MRRTATRLESFVTFYKLAVAAVAILNLFHFTLASDQENYEEHELGKRFSMNYLDMVDPQNPRSWKNMMSAANGQRPPQKKFSMNYLDLIDPNDPVSWRNKIQGKPQKRFSMNFLDTLGAGDPLSWENTMRHSGDITTGRVSQQRRERSSSPYELQSKRSDVLTQSTVFIKAKIMADNIDTLLRLSASTYGQAACTMPIWIELLRLRGNLESYLNPDNTRMPYQDLC